MVAISVGAIAKPATNSTTPITQIEPTKAIGTITRASTTRPDADPLGRRPATGTRR